jgi:predicted transcriptional regulator
MRKPPLGELELEVLRFISDNAPCTVRDATDAFAESHGLARTTILTVMERLRKKAYLERVKSEGSFAYSAAHDKGEVLQEIVKEFVERKLGGSLTPFVAYLTDAKGLTPSEVDSLRAMVDDLDSEDSDAK